MYSYEGFFYHQICAQAMPYCTPRNISMRMYGRWLCGIYENRINYQLKQWLHRTSQPTRERQRRCVAVCFREREGETNWPDNVQIGYSDAMFLLHRLICRLKSNKYSTNYCNNLSLVTSNVSSIWVNCTAKWKCMQVAMEWVAVILVKLKYDDLVIELGHKKTAGLNSIR